MPCYFPMQVVFATKDDGKKIVQFCPVNSGTFVQGGSSEFLGQFYKDGRFYHAEGTESLPCGKCIGCRLERSRQWAVRCVHEAKMYEDNCFLTLTYEDDKLPEHGTLVRKHVQDFMKRLRIRNKDKKISVFYCGEYGDQLSRPHYHLCLFNHDFKDKYEWSKQDGKYYYRSPTLDSLWNYGHHLLSDFSFETAAYVARYCTKKVNGKDAKSFYGEKVPEFVGMSLRPAIGKRWFERFASSDLIPHDNVISRGHESKVPRYYDKLRERMDPDAWFEVKQARKELAKKGADNATHDRLLVRKKCKEAKIKLLTRKYENGI